MQSRSCAPEDVAEQYAVRRRSFDDTVAMAPLKLGSVKVEPRAESIDDDPPSYDKVVTQEREERRLIGALLLRASHLFGMHPFRAPYLCAKDVCARRALWDRVCVPDLLLCLINIAVVLNHLSLSIQSKEDAGDPDDGHSSSLFSSKNADFVMCIVDSLFPLVCIVGMLFCSFFMHELLRCLTDTHFHVFSQFCTMKMKRWRIVLYAINGLFVLGALLQIPQNFMIELRAPPPNRTRDIMEYSLKEMNHVQDKVLVFVDRYYYPLINFGVVKIPQLFIMMISIRVAIMFQTHAASLKNTPLSRIVLQRFFVQLNEIIAVFGMLEACFNKLILAIVATSMARVIFTSYLTVMQMIQREQTGVLTYFLPNQDEGGPSPQGMAMVMVLEQTCGVIYLLLNVFWTVMFIVPIVWCNEVSRAALPVITSVMVADDAKSTKDQIVQRLMDPSWGLTLGKLVKGDRTLVMTLVSLIFTIVVVWLQLSLSNTPAPAATVLVNPNPPQRAPPFF